MRSQGLPIVASIDFPLCRSLRPPDRLGDQMRQSKHRTADLIEVGFGEMRIRRGCIEM
jgi:hypothetical protein